MADTAPVHMLDMKGQNIIRKFYERCGLETIGPGRIKTGDVSTFKTLEDLFDHLLANGAAVQIVVCHGSSDRGLLVKFATESAFTATGAVIATLSALADKGGVIPSDNSLTNVAAQMGVKTDTALRLIDSLIKLRKRKLILHIRGCNLGANETLMKAYKTALGCAAITAPNCRMIYSTINPHKPSKGTSMGDLTAMKPKTPNTRRRFFPWPENSYVGPIIIDIRDIDGHSRLDSDAFINDPPLSSYWGEKLLGAWKQSPGAAGSNSFVLPLLWDNNESTWHTPLEDGYRKKLVLV